MKNFNPTRSWNVGALVTMLSLAILFGSHSIFGQDGPKAVMIDQYRSSVSCHDIRSRIEILMQELAISTSSNGVVVIRGSHDKPLSIFHHRMLLLGYINIRGFDSSRITFLRGQDQENVSVQLWKLPAGTTLPGRMAREWNYRLPADLTHVKLYEDSRINEECPDSFTLDEYRRFLVDNSQMVGEVVIKTESNTAFRKRRLLILENLRKSKIDPTRVRFKFLQEANEDIEYWLISTL